MEQVAVDPALLPEDVEMVSAPQKKVPAKIHKVQCENIEPVPVAGDEFIRGLAVVLSLWVQETATAGKPQQLSRFHSSAVPGISIHDYLKRLRKYFLCTDECFVHALVYIDRIGKHNDSMTVCDLTVHRLLMIAAMIAAKFHDDKFYANFYYGKAGGMTLKEVNLLEVVMLKELDWQVLVSVEEYQLYHSLVCQAMACP